ncbi:MAG: hypothetical protein R3B82_20940 [Sandaracinaceae bacterium]
MLLLKSDLEPHETSPGITQTRALLEFGRYLGCWALRPDDGSGDARQDLMGGGNRLRPWHGWPWWRRYPGNLERDRAASDGDTEHSSYSGPPTVVVVHLAGTDQRTRRTELGSEVGRSEQEQQELLRDQSLDVTAGEVIGMVVVVALVATVVVGTLLIGIGIAVYLAEE